MADRRKIPVYGQLGKKAQRDLRGYILPASGGGFGIVTQPPPRSSKPPIEITAGIFRTEALARIALRKIYKQKRSNAGVDRHRDREASSSIDEVLKGIVDRGALDGLPDFKKNKTRDQVARAKFAILDTIAEAHPANLVELMYAVIDEQGLDDLKRTFMARYEREQNSRRLSAIQKRYTTPVDPLLASNPSQTNRAGADGKADTNVRIERNG